MPNVTFSIIPVNESAVSNIPSGSDTSDTNNYPATTDPLNSDNPSNNDDLSNSSGSSNSDGFATATGSADVAIPPTSNDSPDVVNVLAFLDRAGTCSIIPPSDPTGAIVIPAHIRPDKSVIFPLCTGTPIPRALNPLTGTIIFPDAENEPDGNLANYYAAVSIDAQETEQHTASGEGPPHPEDLSPVSSNPALISHMDEGLPVLQGGLAGLEVMGPPPSSSDPTGANLWRLDTFLRFSCCSHKHLFAHLDICEGSVFSVKLSDDKHVAVHGIGTIALQFGNFQTTLCNVYFTPDNTNNIISMWQLQNDCNIEVMSGTGCIELLEPKTLQVLSIGPCQSEGYFLRSLPHSLQTAGGVPGPKAPSPEPPEDTLNTWLLKRNIPHSLTSFRVHFLDLTEIAPPGSYTTSTGERVDVAGRGTISLRLGDLDTHLPDVLYVPSARENILSAELLNAVPNISLLFEREEIKITNRGTLNVLTSGPRTPDGYLLTSSVIINPELIPSEPANLEDVLRVFPQPLHPPQHWFASTTYGISITPYLALFTAFNVTRTFRHPSSLGGDDWIVHGVGMVKLVSGNGQELELERVYYVPDARRNVFSVEQVNREGHGSCHVGNGKCYLYRKVTGRFVGEGVWTVEEGFRVEMWPAEDVRQREAGAAAAAGL